MNIRKILKIVLPIIIIVLITSIIIFLIGKFKNKKTIDEVYEILEINNIQETENTDFSFDFNNDTGIIGIIKIDKINFEGLVYEGIDLNTLDKGVGHFENSPIFNGNVCLAAHNSSKLWAKLNKLEVNDIINYFCVLGTKQYVVYNIQEIDDTDWSLLQDTDNNIITLITCIKNTPEKRLCVQAIEKI